MNQIQKALLVVGTALFVMCGVFPPINSIPPGRHAFLFTAGFGRIDVVNLSIRGILIVVLTGVLICLNRTPRA